jgi:hypothetical protein
MTATPLRQREPATELKRRVLYAVRAEPAPTRKVVRRRTQLLLGGCIVIALAIFVHFGGIRTYDRPALLVGATYLGSCAIAGAALSIAVSRTRSMLGRSTAALLVLIVGTPLVLLAWKIAVTLPFGPAMTAPWPGRPGFRCLGLTLAMGAPLLLAFLAMRRRSDPVHPGTAGAALGIAAGVAAGTLVDLWCPVAYLPHLLLGHILPLLGLAGFGAWAGRRSLGL